MADNLFVGWIRCWTAHAHAMIEMALAKLLAVWTNQPGKMLFDLYSSQP
jgi:hypothetical protein